MCTTFCVLCKASYPGTGRRDARENVGKEKKSKIREDSRSALLPTRSVFSRQASVSAGDCEPYVALLGRKFVSASSLESL